MLKNKILGGFTLLEVLMAASVLTIGILGTIAGLNIALTARVHNRELALATNIARLKYEELANYAMNDEDFRGIFNRYKPISGGLKAGANVPFDNINPDNTDFNISADVSRILRVPTDGLNRSGPVLRRNGRDDDGDGKIDEDDNTNGIDDEAEAGLIRDQLAWIDFPINNFNTNDNQIVLDENLNEQNAPNTYLSDVAREFGMLSSLPAKKYTFVRETTLPPGKDYEILPVRITVRWQGGMGIREHKFHSILVRPKNEEILVTPEPD